MTKFLHNEYNYPERRTPIRIKNVKKVQNSQLAEGSNLGVPTANSSLVRGLYQPFPPRSSFSVSNRASVVVDRT
jgi:hypothetical protein